jgi:hypothetical protein
MLTLLLNPFVRKIAIGVVAALALLIAYGVWTHHLEAVGAATEKAKEAAVAVQHEQEVVSKATAVDQAVAKDPTPQNTLQQEWSQP